MPDPDKGAGFIQVFVFTSINSGSRLARSPVGPPECLRPALLRSPSDGPRQGEGTDGASPVTHTGRHLRQDRVICRPSRDGAHPRADLEHPRSGAGSLDVKLCRSTPPDRVRPIPPRVMHFTAPEGGAIPGDSRDRPDCRSTSHGASERRGRSCESAIERRIHPAQRAPP